MAEKKEIERQPMPLKSLAELKRAIKPGVEVVATYHANHPALVGVRRIVTKVQTNGFFSKIKDPTDPNCEKYNEDRGFRSDYYKAGLYSFDGDTITVMDSRSKEPRVLYKLQVFDMAPMAMAESDVRPPLVGRVSFANGEEIEFTDADKYIAAVRQELPFRATSGFAFETLGSEPALRKAIDDLVCNEFGEENLLTLEDYALPEDAVGREESYFVRYEEQERYVQIFFDDEAPCPVSVKALHLNGFSLCSKNGAWQHPMDGDEDYYMGKVKEAIGNPWVVEYGPPFFSETPKERVDQVNAVSEAEERETSHTMEMTLG